jgi:hypothetical protein
MQQSRLSTHCGRVELLTRLERLNVCYWSGTVTRMQLVVRRSD